MKNSATNLKVNTASSINASRLLGETKTATTTLKGKANGESTPKVSELISIEDAVTSYQKIAKSRTSHLVKMKAIGDLLCSIRAEHDADQDFSKAVMATDLKVINRWDRNDMMWLSANWKEVQSLKKDKQIASTSVNYLRKLIKKAAKAAEDKANPTPKVSQGDTDKGNGVTETGSHKRDVVDIAKTAIAECNNNSITVKQLIAALQAELKLTK